MLECNGTIIPSDFQTYFAKKRQESRSGIAKFESRLRDLEKVYDGDYDCNGNHNHEGAKNASECRLNNETEETVGLHNLPSGFAVHHVLCFGAIVVHNSISLNWPLFLVVFLVFLDVSALLRISLYDKHNAENKPEDRARGIVTGRDCTDSAEGAEDDRDNTKCFHDSMTLSIKLHFCVQSIMPKT